MAKKPASFEYNGTLVKVLDGDTIDAYIDLGFDLKIKKRIRYMGIDTWESRTRDLEEKKKRYSIDISTLEAVSPLAVLARGYAIVSDEENNILRSSKELTVNQKIKARFKEGQVIAQVVEHVDET